MMRFVSKQYLFRNLSGKSFFRNFRQSLSPRVNPESSLPESRVLLKPFFFTLGFSGVSFLGAMIWQYENLRAHSLFHTSYKKYHFARQFAHERWSQLTDGQKIFAPIALVNTFVFLSWRYGPLKDPLLKFFCSNPSSKSLCLPMVLSVFSHQLPLHFGLNMYVLYSFMTVVVSNLGIEQFGALYLTAGVFSSFTSLFVKVLIHKRSGASLGASGAICAVLGYFGTIRPNAEMQIAFLPIFTFSASSAIQGLVLIDFLGIVFKWRVIDHAAHLGGTLFGVLWASYGQPLIWSKRDKVMRIWHHYIRGYK